MLWQNGTKIVYKMFWRRRRHFLPRRNDIFFIVAALFLFLVINGIIKNNTVYTPNRPPEPRNRDFDRYVTKFEYSTWRNTSVKKILVWTPFFGKWDWVQEIEQVLVSCTAACVVTKDKSELETSDAVLFHPNDIWYYRSLLGTLYQRYIEMPLKRRPDQVWVTFSMEPMVYMWGHLPADTFNWTMLYRRESTIFAPFSDGYQFNKQILEDQKQRAKKSYFKDKTKFASTLVSNCQDQANRYRITAELKKYVDIDDFGKCSGRFLCPAGMPTAECGEKYLSKYKFYLAFENSFCRDYISEKFWFALERRQIPVIAAPQYSTELLPPRSYLNVFDFPSIKDLASRMIEIGNNETLYNSYFDWIESYKADLTSWHCKLCRALHTNMTAQSYTDMDAWVRDDICYKSSTASLVGIFFDRLLFDLGLS